MLMFNAIANAIANANANANLKVNANPNAYNIVVHVFYRFFSYLLELFVGFRGLRIES